MEGWGKVTDLRAALFGRKFFQGSKGDGRALMFDAMTIRRLSEDVRTSLSRDISAKIWMTAEEGEEGSFSWTRREFSNFSWVTILDRLWLLSVGGQIPKQMSPD